MKHWIFDLDNTLVDSFPSYTQVLVDVTSQYGVFLTDEDKALVRHLILPKFLDKYLKSEDIKSAFQKVIELNLARQFEIKLFPGIIELLTLLHSKGCTLSVFTARELVTARGILNTTGMDIFFGQLVSRDCVTNSKPSPDGINKILNLSQSSKFEALMIGDHQTDIEAAKAAGIKAISVCWDDEESELVSLSDYHFTQVSDLYAWAEKILLTL